MVGDAVPDFAQLNGQGQDHHISWFLSAVFLHHIEWVGGVCVKMHVCLCINGWVEDWRSATEEVAVIW